MKSLFVIIFIVFICHVSIGQKIQGTVFEKNNNAIDVPLPGVNVYWAGTQTGTSSNSEGQFTIKRLKEHKQLVISFIGYQKDTLIVNDDQNYYTVILSLNNDLKEVEILEKETGSHVSRLNPILTTKITGGELRKAACCNLSESFETNASVDVSYSDAVTGAKQIKLLGLAGIYTQFLRENIPTMRGLATTYGLEYIPGTWMESIYVSKGTASVKNGYESVTGQINLEFKKPENSEKLYLNLYANHLGKFEGNAYSAYKLSEYISTMVLLHGETFQKKHDFNKDSFLDRPLTNQLNIMNRWRFKKNNVGAQFGFNILSEERSGGQVDFVKGMTLEESNPYGINVKTNRYEVFTKNSYLFNRPGTSIGFINSYVYHDQQSFFGLNNYNATEHNYYGNLMFQSYIGNTNHTYTAGISYLFDQFDENLNDSTFSKIERVPGSFIEYTFTLPEQFMLILGSRIDFHNIYGTLFTPRMHLKYEINYRNIFRASVGKGYRSPNIIAENTYLLASSRKLVFLDDPDIEEAWNYGINYTRYFDINDRELVVNVEFYRTDFTNQLVIDRDTDIYQALIYNLKGKSYSNSLQFEANYELFKGFDLVAAFRYNDVKMTINDDLVQKPLVNRYKGLVTFSYLTKLKKWQFDFTAQLNGDSRLPDTKGLPDKYQRSETSPVYTLLNAQITKYFKKWDVYLGGENLTNYKQDDPIIAADDPFGKYFDSSLVWGPLMGIKVYAGIRVAIK